MEIVTFLFLPDILIDDEYLEAVLLKYFQINSSDLRLEKVLQLGSTIRSWD